MFEFKRTTSDNLDFKNLVTLLDEELIKTDGFLHSFYSQFNKTDKIKNVVLYYIDGFATGCGSFKEFDSKTVEIKRMFVKPEFRKKGIAYIILKELEQWANEIGYSEFILETGKIRLDAIALYQKSGYSVIPNYGQYKNIEESICLKKIITPSKITSGIVKNGIEKNEL